MSRDADIENPADAQAAPTLLAARKAREDRKPRNLSAAAAPPAVESAAPPDEVTAPAAPAIGAPPPAEPEAAAPPPPDTPQVHMVAICDIEVPPDRLRALRQDVVDEIAASIGGPQGLVHPILLRRGANGGLILTVGRHRLEAERQRGHAFIRAEIRDLDEDEARLAEIDENLVRADLSPAERALHFRERKRLYEQAHPETKHGAVGRGGKSSQNEKSFVEDTAAKTGKGRSTIARDVARANNIGDLLPDVIGTSLDRGDELDALAKLSEPEQQALARRAANGETVSAKTRVKQVRRQEREQGLAEKTKQAAAALAQLPPASVIVSDPALKFKTWSEAGMDRSADNHYPCGTIEQMIALKPPMADDAILFLWTCSPQLENSLALMKAWGFQYKFYSGWDKGVEGTGRWARSLLELIVVGTKGSIPAPAPGEQFPQLFRARRGKHSEKPDEVYEAIERLFPNLIKLEMFARKPRDGWLTWGNESDLPPSAAPEPPAAPDPATERKQLYGAMFSEPESPQQATPAPHDGADQDRHRGDDDDGLSIPNLCRVRS
jgi:N6-adenosine-specific RNA methylase IME4